MKLSTPLVAVLALRFQCMAVGEPEGNDAGSEECSLLQGRSLNRSQDRALNRSQGWSWVTRCKSACCVLVITTPGAEYPCCGCPNPLIPGCGCGKLQGTDMHDMAVAFAKGVRDTSDCQVEIADISKFGGCPDFGVVKGYDAIVLAAPSYGGGVAPDVKTLWHRFGTRDIDGLRCKVGAAITRNGGYYTGAQPTLEEIHRMMLQRQMIIASGPNWNTGEGAAEMLGTWPFPSNGAPDKVFLVDAEALGARVGNITQAMKKFPSMCGSNIFGATLAPANPYYALAQVAAHSGPAAAAAAGTEERPVPDGAPEWPGWSGQQGARQPPYVSLYKTNFSWVDPTCGNSPATTRVLIITTPGANGYMGGPCCGCPAPNRTIWPGTYPPGSPGPGNPSGKTRCGCFKHTGDRTLQMAQAIRFGFHNASGGCANSGVQVDIRDIAENTTGTEAGCPTWEDVRGYDMFVFGAPTWNGLPPSDIISYTNLWPLKAFDLRCKLAAGFSTGGGYQAGAQMVVESLKRIAMTFQMFWVGGPQWNIGEAAMANTGTFPFSGSTKVSDGSYDLSVFPYFLNDAWGLGARLFNLTQCGEFKQLPSLCGPFPGQEDAERR